MRPYFLEQIDAQIEADEFFRNLTKKFLLFLIGYCLIKFITKSLKHIKRES